MAASQTSYQQQHLIRLLLDSPEMHNIDLPPAAIDTLLRTAEQRQLDLSGPHIRQLAEAASPTVRQQLTESLSHLGLQLLRTTNDTELLHQLLNNLQNNDGTYSHLNPPDTNQPKTQTPTPSHQLLAATTNPNLSQQHTNRVLQQTGNLELQQAIIRRRLRHLPTETAIQWAHHPTFGTAVRHQLPDHINAASLTAEDLQRLLDAALTVEIDVACVHQLLRRHTSSYHNTDNQPHPAQLLRTFDRRRRHQLLRQLLSHRLQLDKPLTQLLLDDPPPVDDDTPVTLSDDAAHLLANTTLPAELQPLLPKLLSTNIQLELPQLTEQLQHLDCTDRHDRQVHQWLERATGFKHQPTGRDAPLTAKYAANGPPEPNPDDQPHTTAVRNLLQNRDCRQCNVLAACCPLPAEHIDDVLNQLPDEIHHSRNVASLLLRTTTPLPQPTQLRLVRYGERKITSLWLQQKLPQQPDNPPQALLHLVDQPGNAFTDDSTNNRTPGRPSDTLRALEQLGDHDTIDTTEALNRLLQTKPLTEVLHTLSSHSDTTGLLLRQIQDRLGNDPAGWALLLQLVQDRNLQLPVGDVLNIIETTLADNPPTDTPTADQVT